MQVDAHRDFALLHHALPVLLAVVRVAAAFARHVHVVQVQVDQVLLEVVDAGIADRRQDAAEVRIAREKSRLDQRRMGDGVSHLPAFVLGAAAFDLHADELGGALAIAHDGLRELLRDLDHGIAQAAAVAFVQSGNSGVAGLLCRDQHEGIVGRGVAVDRDAVERQVCGLADQRLQQLRLEHRIGGDEAEHRRHVRADHAGALGDAGDGDRPAPDDELARGRLGQRVGGHDRLGGQAPLIGLQVGQCSRQSIDDALARQVFHDDAGGERQHLRGRDVQLLRQRLASGVRAPQAVGAGAGVGIAGVDQQRADAVAGSEVRAANLHRRGTEAVLREHAGDAGALGQGQHQQVASMRLAHAGHRDAEHHARDGVQVEWIRGLQVDGHGGGTGRGEAGL